VAAEAESDDGFVIESIAALRAAAFTALISAAEASSRR
jgi:hypothetical protein